MNVKNALILAALLLVAGFGSTASAQVIPKYDVYTVDSSGITVSAGSTNSGHAYCTDATDEVLGGGCWNGSFGQNNLVSQQFPEPTSSTSSTDAYFCEWHNTLTYSVTAHVRIMCVAQ